MREARALPLGPPKQRAVLGFLLLHANESVSRERLVDGLWGDAAPPTVNAALSGYLMKLRRALANGDEEDAGLATRAPGGVLYVGADGAGGGGGWRGGWGWGAVRRSPIWPTSRSRSRRSAGSRNCASRHWRSGS